MNHIKPYHAWIGHAGEGDAFKQLFQEGIRAVIQLALEETPAQPPRELIFLRFPLVDGSGNSRALLSLAIHSVALLLRQHVPLLVCGGAGNSRSPSILAAALALVHQQPLEQCLEHIASCHKVDVSPAVWADVREVFKTLVKKEPSP